MTNTTAWVRLSGRYVAAAMLGQVNIAQFAHGTHDENVAGAVALCQSWPEWDGSQVNVVRS